MRRDSQIKTFKIKLIICLLLVVLFLYEFLTEFRHKQNLLLATLPSSRSHFATYSASSVPVELRTGEFASSVLNLPHPRVYLDWFRVFLVHL